MTQADISEAIHALDRAIDSAIGESRIVGTVVMLAQDGKIVHCRAAGLADREAGVEMTPETWFRYASVSKPFTTVAALKLIRDGRLSADDPVSRWLPDFRPRLMDGSEAPITVGHLMAHMAGLDYGFNQTKDGPYHRAGVSDGITERGLTLDENLRRIASVPIDLIPGQDWRYSVATDVLGAIIEAVTETPLQFAMAELVTGPLSLDAAYALPSTTNLAVPYADARPEPRRMRGITHVQGMLPEGQHFSFDPDRIHAMAAFPSGGGGMAGTAAAALGLLETLRTGDFLGDQMRAEASAVRFADLHPLRGPGWGHAWAGAVITDPGQVATGLSKGSLSWGGIYGHCWVIDPIRKRTLIGLTNTAIEGMSGEFAIDLCEAVARQSDR